MMPKKHKASTHMGQNKAMYFVLTHTLHAHDWHICIVRIFVMLKTF